MAPPDPNRANGLANTRVLVTRPVYQQQQLIGLIEREGGSAYRFPTLEITPTDKQTELQAVLRALDTFDIAIFVSPNAAEYVFESLSDLKLSLPDSLQLACVGKGCSQTVTNHGHEIDAVPVSGIGSDGLLQHELMQSVGGKRVVIFRGNGGRELLAETLRERGANVEYCECYRRTRPQLDPRPLIQAWRNGQIDIVTITSTQALKNLWSMLGEDGSQLLLSTPVVVISERIAETALSMGCTRVMVTDDTSDTAIVDTIKKWRMEQISI